MKFLKLYTNNTDFFPSGGCVFRESALLVALNILYQSFIAIVLKTVIFTIF